MLEIFRRASANNLTVEEMAEQLPVGPVAVIDKPESEPPFAEIDPVADGSTQFEPFTFTLGIGAEQQITATRQPEKWTVWMPGGGATDVLTVNHGQRRTGEGLGAGGRTVLTLPGRGGATITLSGAGLTAPCVVNVIASSGLPVEVSPA